MLDSLVYICMCAWYLVLLMLSLVVIVVVACIGVAGVYAVFVNCIVPTTNNWRLNTARTKKELLEIEAATAEVRLNDAKVRKKLSEIKDITEKQADEQNMEILKKW